MDTTIAEPEPLNVIYGVYCACHPEKGIRYVGQSCRGLHKRWVNHLWRASKRKYGGRLYNWMRKHGIENARVRVLESLDNVEQLDDREVYWITRYRTYERGMNTTKGGTWGNVGVTQRGEDNAYAARTEAEVLRICEMLNAGVSQSEIAEDMGITRGNVANISRGSSWAHLTTGVLGRGRMREPRTGFRRGELTPNSKLTPEQVDHIRLNYDPTKGRNTYKLANDLGLHPGTIQSVLRGATWSHHETPGYVPWEGKFEGAALLRAEDVMDIKKRLAAGARGIGRELAREYGVSDMTISDIKRGATWVDVEPAA